MSTAYAPWNHEWNPEPVNHQNDHGLATDDNWPYTT